MKKLLSIIICAACIFSGIITVSAYDVDTTGVKFYINVKEVRMSGTGEVMTTSDSVYTNEVFNSVLSEKRDSAYRKDFVSKAGNLYADEVTAEFDQYSYHSYDRYPGWEQEIINKIRGEYEWKWDNENGGFTYHPYSNGEQLNWDDITVGRFHVYWYELYYDEENYTWRVNGVVVDTVTGQPIEYCKEGEQTKTEPVTEPEPEPEPDPDPVTEPKNDDVDYDKDYTSNFAYIFGYDDNTMAADEALLRCELSAMIHRLVKQNNKLGGFSYNESNPPVYADIEGEWFRSGIEFMYYKGAFTAKKGENIYPQSAVTRGEAFKLICIGLGFTKNTTLSFDAYAEILKNGGYIQGDENGNLNINNMMTRAEFCTIYNRVIGRDNARLVTSDNEKITAETYGFSDLSSSKWYYNTMLSATSAYDEDGYVDLSLRGIRNNLDDYQ